MVVCNSLASDTMISGMSSFGSKLVLVHCGDAVVSVIDVCVVTVIGAFAAAVTGVIGFV